MTKREASDEPAVLRCARIAQDDEHDMTHHLEMLTCPTRRSPPLVYATTDGVVRAPSAFVTMVGRPPSMAATAELVVPKSMPTTCTTSSRMLC